jgi:hypothetical protein
MPTRLRLRTGRLLLLACDAQVAGMACRMGWRLSELEAIIRVRRTRRAESTSTRLVYLDKILGGGMIDNLPET